MATDGPATQEVHGCTLRYDLTQHRMDVLDDAGKVCLRLWSLPDPPGSFDIRLEDHWIEMHNPRGVDFRSEAEGGELWRQ